MRRLWWLPLAALLLLPRPADAQVFGYLERTQLANDADFRARVQYALVRVAMQVADEDPATENHAKKVALARQILIAPHDIAARIAPGVVTQTLVTGAQVSDADLQTAVNATLLTYAKAEIFR